MTSINKAFQELKELKQELSLQAHLLKMDLKDQWDVLLTKFDELEQHLEDNLIDTAQKVGRAEETYFVGTEQEIKQLVEELKSIKQKHEGDN